MRIASIGALLLLGACTSMPSGPNVMVLPGTGKNFDQFKADDFECRQWASQQSGATPDGAAENSGLKSAAVGTVVGATAGAILGGGRGAATGAGAGLIIGSASGAGAAHGSQMSAQRRYDYAFTQCMYAKGHRVPTHGRFESSRATATSPPLAVSPPPPPAGTPPPPPPGLK